jgi:hypothetical protein
VDILYLYTLYIPVHTLFPTDEVCFPKFFKNSFYFLILGCIDSQDSCVVID